MKTHFSPSLLTWLRCFEAVARCGGFTRAAQELHITQGAVSQQIKQLEDWLKTPVLQRLPRRVVLTAEGERLHHVVGDAFRNMDTVIGELRHGRVAAPMEMICAPSFAMRWLMPRMGAFFRCNPDIPLCVQAEVQPLDDKHPPGKHIDAVICFTPTQTAPPGGIAMLDEWMFPVASPEFLVAHPELRTPEDLRSNFLLHDDSPWAGASPLIEWRTWLEHAGVDLPDLHLGQRFNLSQLAVGSAMTGQGIAMGRAAIVFEDVLAGRLVDVFGIFVPSPASYFFATVHQPSESIEALQNWLAAEADEFRHQRHVHLAQQASFTRPAPSVLTRTPGTRQ